MFHFHLSAIAVLLCLSSTTVTAADEAVAPDNAAKSAPATSQPASPAMAYVEAQARAAKAMRDSTEWKEAKENFDAADKAMVGAKTESDKFTVATKKLAARKQLTELWRRGVEDDAGVVKARADMVERQRRAEAAMPARPERATDAPLDRLAIGMTVAQAKAASKGTLRLLGESADGISVYRAIIGPTGKLHVAGPNDNRNYWIARPYIVTFQEGELVSYMAEE
ncbi:MAG: hypothetical protein JWO57_656 [Pseudonocardiales bacterium]|nr:hypothetical protein [Pseudonocardiales bacterium]